MLLDGSDADRLLASEAHRKLREAGLRDSLPRRLRQHLLGLASPALERESRLSIGDSSPLKSVWISSVVTGWYYRKPEAPFEFGRSAPESER